MTLFFIQLKNDDSFYFNIKESYFDLPNYIEADGYYGSEENNILF